MDGKAPRPFFSCDVRRSRLVFRSLVLLAICFIFPKINEGQEAKPQGGDGAVGASMRNVNYRFAENVAVQIDHLSGAFVPVNGHEMPIFDDKESFKIRIESAQIAISLQDLANLWIK